MKPTSKTRVIVLIVKLEKDVQDLDTIVAGRVETIQGVDTAEAIAHADFKEPLVPEGRKESV